MASCITCLLIFSSLIWTYYYTAASARDTIKPGDTLKPGESLNSKTSLCSAKGTFCLGFRTYDNSNSSQLCIWRTVGNNKGWIASRDKPILYPLGVLTLDKNKTLKILDQGGMRLVLYSASRETANTNTSTVVATLLDSGNFILQEVNSLDGSRSQILWQSFDHPTDSLYPGMKLGVNHRNGHILSLTSVQVPSNPKPGPFTLEWEYKTQELQIKRRGVVYWTSGASTSKRFKVLMRRYNFNIVSNGNEDYFTYQSLNQTSTSEWYLTSTGLLYDYGGVDIAKAQNCYGYNTDGGCQRWEKPTCRHVGDIFEQKNGFFRQTTTNSTFPTDPNRSLTISDCRDSCWKNCDCHGFNFLYEDDQSGCQYYTGINWEFIEDFIGVAADGLYMLKTKSPRINDTKKRIFIGTGITAATLLLVVPCIACYVLRRRKFALSGENETRIIEDELLDLMKSDRPTDATARQNGGNMRNDLSVFSYASVMAATCNFSPENKLGQGGFGPVYKGKLMTGQEVAVKRLSKCSGQGTLEFKNELILIYELQHKNLVKLFGFCIHGEERMLIYEYMPNKSLDYFLFDSTRVTLLDWKKRFSIIEGIAQGLLYLHKYSRVTVIHRDLKASNILLDENMNPKISDFGMARIFKHNELEANTNRVVGTYGYMSPEYAMEGLFSIKSDVYSFGVLMLEIVSGRRNNSFYNADRLLNIVGYAWELWKEGTVLELMDPALGDSCIKDQLLRCVHVGLLCVEENAADRPTMPDVVSMLTNQSTPLPLPAKAAFFAGRNVVEDGPSGEKSGIFSLNEISNSTAVPR
ncbi:LOW QUALITY PROTEIN: G-type lectin S-receptor-like serine/threonine-protein kinase CES101 [Pyrus x bretschneideri]|uniref:LOW QUALITY PROTEIN: G-type lectin S-receptor-like serine/threonine-protein kinase CES101 n=1 Tax=Pyrus x bretschneideri TaxID=225117 RepID=UPI00202E3846|nr:LOW QUALITY PROTEIN: G-type lectin S-receptor-like serine/threonine-protein kinase CES101 [Pyrus x bretschneideri]